MYWVNLKLLKLIEIQGGSKHEKFKKNTLFIASNINYFRKTINAYRTTVC